MCRVSDETILWISLPAVVITALVLDLFVFNRGNRTIPTRRAVFWTGIWISLGLAFGVLIWSFQGGTVATEYFTGYLVEYSLSVDNVAVFAILFTVLAVPEHLRYRALFWAIILAILMRAVLIGIGGALLATFWWMPFVFGAFLIVTGIRMARHTDATESPEDSRILQLIRRVIPVTPDFHEQRLWVRIDGRRIATPMFVALLALAAFDLMFAVDSVPAIYAITKDPFIVLAANAFALLGLRTLYFAVANALQEFIYIQPSLAIILGWVGTKMIVGHWYKVPPVLSLSFVLSILAVGMILSIRKKRALTREAAAEI
jgi:tellurite resistance protein TerC